MRVHDWWGKLNAFLIENGARPREYGVWDCWQLTAGGILAMTGIDYRDSFPKYSTVEEGLQILIAHGGAEAMMTELFGPSKHVAFAQRGDVVLNDIGEGPAGGLCLGVDCTTVSPGGTERVPTLSGLAAFTV